MLDAADFAKDVNPDGFISLGGGSTIDTAKVANLLSTYPADLKTYVNKPVGDATPPARRFEAAYCLPDNLRHRIRNDRDRGIRLS